MPFQCPRCHAEIERNYKACPHCGEPITDFQRRYADEPIDGKYKIVERLGTGGMGEVYKVEHTYLGTTRVIKVIRSQIADSTDAHDRFLREARLATRVQHPNVATLHDFSGLPDGSHYMVWEFIEGENIAQLMKRRGVFPVRQELRLAAQAERGLDANHRAGNLHCDISPENLMVTNGAEVKIIDLGVAKSEEIDNAVTKTGIFVGKLRYASPEHLGVLEDNEKIDGRADIYSLGVVLYEMLTGRPPFEATSPHQYLMHHSSRESQVMPMPVLPANMPAGLQAVLARALDRNRTERFATAAGFATALEEVDRPLDTAEADATMRLTPAPTIVGVDVSVVAPAPRRRDPPPSRRRHTEGTRAPIVVIALLAIAFAGVIAALVIKPKIVPTVPVSAPVTTTTVAPAPAQSTIEVKQAPTTIDPRPASRGEGGPKRSEGPGEGPAPKPQPDPQPQLPELQPQPQPPPQSLPPYIEGGDDNANEATVASAQHALSGTKRVALRANDARWSNELTRQLTRHDIAVADDADVIIHFDGTLDHLGRGRKRRAASASITKGGRTVFRYELKPEEYRVGDDPAEAFARILGDVLR